MVALICFGIYVFMMITILSLLYEAEDARQIRYYIGRNKARIEKSKQGGVTIVNCTFDFSDSPDDVAIKMRI